MVVARLMAEGEEKIYENVVDEDQCGRWRPEGDTGVDFHSYPVPLPQKKILSRPNPGPELKKIPVPSHSW